MYIQRDPLTKRITASATYAEGWEQLQENNPEYLDYIRSIETPKNKWLQIRVKRDNLLSQTDWIFAPDVTLKNKESWLTYRQALRDVPQNFATPEEVVWPIKPE